MREDTKKLINIFLSNKKFFSDINWAYQYCDEPQIFTFNVYCKNLNKYSSGIYKRSEPHSTGCSFDFERALNKSIGEIIERFCCSCYREKGFILDSYNKLKNSINPTHFASFAENRKNLFQKNNINVEDKINWIRGKSFFNKNEMLIPAQLIYINYRFTKSEKVIQFASSNGAAGDWSKDKALCKSILELIEREAFLIFYLNKISPKEVLLDSINLPSFHEIRKKFVKYNLKLRIFNITTDLEVPIYLTVIIDPTLVGMPISFGSKADFNHETALIGAIEEALQVRTWIRSLHETSKNRYKVHKPYEITEIFKRGLFWYNPELLKSLDFLLKPLSSNLIKFPKVAKKSFRKQFNNLRKSLIREKIDLYYIDLTLPEFKKNGFFVIKSISPQIMPLYFNEKYPYLKCERLFDVPVKLGYLKYQKDIKELNQIPHPFL